MPDTMKNSVEEQMDTPRITVSTKPTYNRGLIIFTLIFSILGTVLGGASLWFALYPVQDEPLPQVVEEPEEVEGVDFLRFNDIYVPISSQLAKNQYDLEGFQTVGDKIIYENAKLGIDVSQHQGDIDWAQVAADGVEFAIIRVGYRGYGESGLVMADEKFQQNMEGAKAAGLDVGVYFFSQATSVWEAKEEADFVLEALKGYDLQLPVYFDWEFVTHTASARTNGARGTSITLYAQMFCEEIREAGYQPAIYFNQSLGYLYLDLESLGDYPFWLAAYRSSPNFHYHFDIWQYSHTGSVAGIQGNVDLNLMFALDEEA